MNVFASILPLFFLALQPGAESAPDDAAAELPAAKSADKTLPESSPEKAAEPPLPEAGSEGATPAQPLPETGSNERGGDAPAAAGADAEDVTGARAVDGWDRVSGARPASSAAASGARPGPKKTPRQSQSAALPFAPHGPFISVGYGLHRYTTKTLSMEQDTGGRRAFDGGALSVRAGYLTQRGLLFGVDWTHHSGRNSLRTMGGEASLELNSDFVSLLGGLQVGGHVRAHVAILAGLAHGGFMRSIRVEHADAETGESVEQRDAKKSSANALLLGADLGLVVMPTEWLAIGLHLRADRPFFSDALNGTSGIYAGLSASCIYPL